MTDSLVPLADSHLHLQDIRLMADEEQVMDRAWKAGVRRLVVNGSEEEDWPPVWRLAKKYPQVIPCFGLHPWYVRRRSPLWMDKLEWFLHAIPSGVGEIGLDRYRPERDEKAQEEVFLSQLEVARRLHRPVMIHCLRAWGWMTDLLAREDPFPDGLMIHAYSGPRELIPVLAGKGAFFSFTATFVEETRTRAREALIAIPSSRLLLETDAPDLPLPDAPDRITRRDRQGKRISEPADLAIVCREAAFLRKEKPEELAEVLWQNSNTLLHSLTPR